MVEQEFKNYLTLIRSLLRLKGNQGEQIGHELRDHLETRLDELMSAGKSREDAIQIALEEFGDASAVATSFAAMAQLQRRKWIMRFTTVSVLVLFVAALFVMSIWPSNGQVGPGANSIAQDDDPFSETKKVDPFASGGSTAKGDPFGTDSGNSGQANSGAKSRRPERPERLRSEKQRNEEIEKILNEPVTFDFSETIFSDVIAEIQEKKGIQILIDDTSGIVEDDAVTISLTKARLSTFLNLLLRKYDSTFVIVDGILIICDSSSINDFPLYTRVFDCRKLIAAIEKYESSQRSIEDILMGLNGNSGETPVDSGSDPDSLPNAGQGITDTPGDAKKLQADDEPANPLVKVIKQISPNDWQEDDGTTIQSIGGMLIVNQRREMILKIETLLDELESNLLR